MNENHSNTEWIYRKRLIGPKVREIFRDFPAVVISGARQVGKSTFLLEEFPDFHYLTLDDFSTLEQAKIDPFSLWMGKEKVIIDEAQRSPEILSAVKMTIDRQKGVRFLISGSADLLLMKGVSESLAGRAIYLKMYPMLYSEVRGETDLLKRWENLWENGATIREEKAIDPLPYIFRGFMPPLLFIKEEEKVPLFWESYVRTYLERDLRELSQIESIVDFRRVLAAFALRSGNLLNQTEIARDTGVSQPTVSRYLKILEVSHLVERVYSYHKSRTKRIVKSPKLFFADPGLCVYLTGYYNVQALSSARELGSFFETGVFLHLKVLSELLTPKAQLYYLRTTEGKEVDFVLEHGPRLAALEVKCTDRPLLSMAKNLIAFVEEHPKTFGILIHKGGMIGRFHSRVLALPWWYLA